MIIINCIYKTNKYKFSLFIITNINVLKKSFYITFCFLIAKEYNDYF